MPHHQPGTHHSCVVSTATIKCKPLQRGVNMATYTVHAFGKESLFFLNGGWDLIFFAKKNKAGRHPTFDTAPATTAHHDPGKCVPRHCEVDHSNTNTNASLLLQPAQVNLTKQRWSILIVKK
jgi:hypothetical protein